jgi:hypothetical protein
MRGKVIVAEDKKEEKMLMFYVGKFHWQKIKCHQIVLIKDFLLLIKFIGSINVYLMLHWRQQLVSLVSCALVAVVQ